ncbi:GGDEF domain-containing protein [Methylobacillus gramineus]|uniref:GGDEF domain-containing protein n=1 Tax=Methylobacillus gramineus TaxID=755169 RepID=UPI001CFF879D|nr:sensor domain-containing diguanylate cyclase [Methylobacillus gramineus]MCB5183943.1 GGDEF domain-containing protein [Methylobacillus gramineus]
MSRFSVLLKSRFFVLLIVIAIVPLFLWLSHNATKELVESRAWLEHTYTIISHQEDLRADIDEVEIFRQETFINRKLNQKQQMDLLSQHVAETITVLQKLTITNNYQQVHLREFKKVIAFLLKQTASDINKLSATGLSYESYNEQALPLMENARLLLGEMQANEQALLGTRLQNSERRQHELKLILMIMGVSFVSLIAFLLAHMYREITQRRTIEAGLIESQAQNEVTVYNLSLMGELGSLLQACSSIEESLDVIRQFSIRLLNVDAGVIYLFRESRNQIEEKTSWGNPAKSDLVFQPDDCWALRRGEPHLSGGLHNSLRCRHQHHEPAVISLCIPIVAQGNVLGILHLENHHGNEMTEVQRRLAINLASQIALAMASMRLRETLRNLSVRDPLTGLFNRRYMEESLQRELVTAQRKNRPLGIVILDIDHFKTFNDTFGHDAGDFLLREVGALLTAHSRASDIACRFGGEEFVLIYPETAPEVVEQRTEQIRQAIFALQLQHFGRALGQVSASFGLAFFPQHGSSGDELLRLADKALYRAKAEGRNRLEVAWVKDSVSIKSNY